jgi:Methyltransferase domain
MSMLRHWKSTIRPLLVGLDDSPLIEIGAAFGHTTKKLVELAAERDAVLHTVDPTPQLDVKALERAFPGCFCFHQARSHDVLESIEPAAAVLIDGDHNWYTVHGELTRLERIATSADRDFPLVMLHDVEWPYARRDMYHDPEAIPEEWRKPWARRGIRQGQSPLDEDGGINSDVANALEEGGPHNGVLTAVEDFLAECPRRLDFKIVRGHSGLGVLLPTDLLGGNPSIRRQWMNLG